MALKVTVSHKDFPAERDFAISGLGLFENGKPRELSLEDEQAYFDLTGVEVKQGLHGPHIKVEGSSLLKGKTPANDDKEVDE